MCGFVGTSACNVVAIMFVIVIGIVIIRVVCLTT